MPIGQQLDAGPAAIVWDVDGTPTTFQTMFEDITFKDEQSFTDIFEAQHGDAPVDKVSTGSIITFEANITRVTPKDLNVLMIGGALSGAADDQILFTNPVGDHMYQYAKKVQIKPIINRVVSVNPTEWIEIFKVIAARAFEISYGKPQRVFHVVFHVFPDQTSTNQGNTHQFGDAT